MGVSQAAPHRSRGVPPCLFPVRTRLPSSWPPAPACGCCWAASCLPSRRCRRIPTRSAGARCTGCCWRRCACWRDCGCDGWRRQCPERIPAVSATGLVPDGRPSRCAPFADATTTGRRAPAGLARHRPGRPLCYKSRSLRDARTSGGRGPAKPSMMAVSYNAWLVTLSVVLAALDAYVAFSVVGRIARSRGPAAVLWTAFGALAMGSGVWAMHFIGMLALEVPIPLGYESRLTTLSAVPVVLATGATLWLLARRATHAGAVMAGCILGLGMVAMHYLGVHALQMQPAIAWRLPWTAASLLLGVGGSVAALWLHSLIWRSERRHRWWLRVLAAWVMGGTAAGVHYLGMAAMRFAPDATSL